MSRFSRERASHWGAFFVWAWFFAAAPAFARECPPDHVDERGVVAQVIDGDTVRLADGRMIRFIGINAPELAHDGRPEEPFARAASQAVLDLLPPGATVGLRYGSERFDRYHRTLAHIYTAAGVSVEARLLAQGLAAYIVVPPNVAQWQCYRATEAEARAANKGAWASFFRPVPVADLARDAGGFRIFTGRIERIGESKRSLWLNFPTRPGEDWHEGVALRIDRADLANFQTWDPRDLKGREVIVRGWTYSYKRQLVMRLRHPAALEIVTDNKHAAP